MKKTRLPSFLALLFATFLVLAAVETFVKEPEPARANASETATLEVPLTGKTEVRRSAETYETLFEIAFLALIGAGFYLVNTRRQ